ncbi:hypothetical protein AOL_s00006g102 [Orbilia oligospora ATCC 24927]|uniref:U1-type domain-containing protein n=1 Tax=Arthrobotrys oligospora (strain ATCC 24927 / CBS 115.81 / DSM 1491) TaxID=756982 RepID=G1WZQ1_ARTOA|nr:hypothetical protein AOL_s00006g102 [Orbilia oligospora ATCC 24927]EGX53644.1 hypothetical protein AOL_s00006g102 [Orbilia oligospora ATCC 24927]
MSEYWVSTKRYWCDRCKMFVKDTPLSRKDHEASPKHQHALQRFLRELHRNKEKEAVAAENTKREAERLNNLENPDYVPKPLARRAADLIEKKPTKTNSFRSEEQKKKHLDELAALGVAMPESYRKEHAMVGEWETVRVIERPATPEDPEDEESKRAKRRKIGDVDEDEDEEEADTKNFRMRTLEYPGDAVASENIGEITFKKKGKSKQAMPTVEYPVQTPVAGPEGVVFKKRGAKAGPKEEVDNEAIEKASAQIPPTEENDDVDSLSRNTDQAKGEDQLENPVMKHEPSEDKTPTPVEPAEEGVAFKSRKARNTNRRRI